MALMTTMREKMHVVLWTLLALFLLSMTIGGLVGGANIIDQIFGNINPQTTIASINGELISPDQFNNLVNQQINSIKSSGQTLNDFQIKRARDKAWDNLIQDVLVTQEVKKLNLSASVISPRNVETLLMYKRMGVLLKKLIQKFYMCLMHASQLVT